MYGEELRPTPLNTMDTRLLNLHAFLQDHTYANRPSRTVESPQSQAPIVPTTSNAVPPKVPAMGLTYVYNPTGNFHFSYKLFKKSEKTSKLFYVKLMCQI